MSKRVLAALVMLGIVGPLTGCNTIQGAGKDIERGGQVIRDTAKDVQKKL
jgi:entericidin B